MTQAVRGQLNRDNLGTGVTDPMRFRRFSPEGGVPVPIYGDQDVSLLVWNLEPGQENSTHVHPERAHIMVVLTGTGEYLKPDQDPITIRAGDYIIIPRGTVHGIRNSGVDRLSYANVSNNNQQGYQRTPVGEQQSRGH